MLIPNLTLANHMANTWKVPTEQSWQSVAQDIAPRLSAGMILALQGPLGAGKTTFVQALAETLGAKRTPKSPTFSMLRTYAVTHGVVTRMLHVDAYRIDDEADLVALDLDAELSDGDAILVLEWPEQVSRWLSKRKHLTLTIEIAKEGRVANLQK